MVGERLGSGQSQLLAKLHNSLGLPDDVPPNSGLKRLMAPGISAIREHWQPFLLIQLGAAALVFAYHFVLKLQQAVHIIGELKVAGGIPFAFAAGALAGGFIPEVAKLITGRLRKFSRSWLAQTSFNAFAYGIVGVQVEQFYRLQSWLFGDGNDVLTLTIKTIVDMGLFSTLISIPTAVVLYEWRKLDFDGKRLLRSISSNFYRTKVAPALLMCWAFWIPILFCVYSLPADLQFPFSILAEAAWSILFVFIATQEPPTH